MSFFEFANLQKMCEKSVLLTLLELRIFLIDDIQPAFSTNQLAINTSLFNGCPDLHDKSMLLFVPV